MSRNPEKNPAHAERMRARWKEPEFRERMLAAQNAHLSSRTEAHRRKVCAAAGLDEITDQQFADYRAYMSKNYRAHEAIEAVFGR